MSETWLSDLAQLNVLVQNYNFVPKQRTSRDFGVGIYIRHLLPYRMVYTSNVIGQVCVEILVKSESFVFCAVYRPNFLIYLCLYLNLKI